MQTINVLTSAFHRAAARKRMIVFYWFFHTLCAALAALPVLGIAIPQLSHSDYGAELMKQFDIAAIAELISTAGEAGSPAGIAILLSALLALAGATFLAGGCVKLLVRDEVPYSPAEFWEGCGRYFWRFLRLALYFLVPYLLLLALHSGLIRAIAKHYEPGIVELPVIYANRTVRVLILLLAGLTATAADLAKVHLVVTDSRKSLRAFLGSLRLVITRPMTVFPVWLLLALLLSAATALYLAAMHRLGILLILFLAQQIYIFFRILLRMTSWAAAAEIDTLLRPLPPEPVPVPVPVASEPPAFEAGAQQDFTI
ncbi:MAG: hypothetical protein HY821_00665 [Acidobacteria bacterium]|nr:hypothetical protein [Acidobacteriota bacterium]